MKKTLLILVFINIVAFIACRKDSTNIAPIASLDAKKGKALMKKYHLILLKDREQSAIAYTKQFKTFEDLDRYLALRSKHVIKRGEGSILNASTITNSKIKGATVFAGYTNNYGNYYAQIHFSGFDSNSYPCYLNLNWSKQSSATSSLAIHGSNFGTWTYVQHTGYDNNNTIEVTGTYTEVYSVSGLYSYEKLFHYKYNSGTWGNGHIYGSASFTPYDNSGGGAGSE
ncbi:MAG: hypothetical protein H7Y13_14285 [Sphingobacteriaceae bacterium]|nr:hypothetical protein [Sphingobacteriaceae bacterium]